MGAVIFGAKKRRNRTGGAQHGAQHGGPSLQQPWAAALDTDIREKLTSILFKPMLF